MICRTCGIEWDSPWISFTQIWRSSRNTGTSRLHWQVQELSGMWSPAVKGWRKKGPAVPLLRTAHASVQEPVNKNIFIS